MNIIFLISLPRSGSTLLQRILAKHPEISTRTEPWLLLPLLYMIKEEGVLADYSHKHSYFAIKDFLGSIDQGELHFESCVRQFANSLYKCACDHDESFFLDKTPRYTIIANQLLEIFPDEKFIFLWRNPLSIIASIIKTFRGNKFMFLGNTVDLYDGFDCFFNSYEQNKEKIFSIKYEDFITNSNKHLNDLFEYLALEPDSKILENFADVVLSGTYGDKTGYLRNGHLNRDSINIWKTIINNPLRKMWCKRYLKWIGPRRLNEMGYSYYTLITELKNVPNNYNGIISDFIYLTVSYLANLVEPFFLKKKIKSVFSGKIFRFLS